MSLFLFFFFSSKFEFRGERLLGWIVYFTGDKVTILTVKYIFNSDLADVQKYKIVSPLSDSPSPKFPTLRRESCLITKLSLGIFYLSLITITLPQAVKELNRGSVEFDFQRACPGSAFHWWGSLGGFQTSVPQAPQVKWGLVRAPHLGDAGRIKGAETVPGSY